MNDEILARLHASAPRRFLGVGVLATLGVMLLLLALRQGPLDIGARVLLILSGGGMLWIADIMRRVTSVTIELTAQQLRCDTGEVIAELSDIASVDRGTFAFKPSNGFLLRLKRPAPRCWRPGLWWRMGRRVGVGGVTPGAQTKAMADMLNALIHQRGATE